MSVMIPDFQLPDWLGEEYEDAIMERMLESLPENMDTTEGGFPWDFLSPTAIEKAEILEYYLPNALQCMFPMWADGEYLDYHASGFGLARKAANPATGTVHITGTVSTEIPEGFVFAVPSVNDSEVIEFATDIAATIDVSGSVDIAVTAIEGGRSGNVKAGSISIMSEPMTGIGTIANETATTGGTEEEDDDALRERILEVAQNNESFVGCDANYVTWAKSISGVGNAFVDSQYEEGHPNYVKLTLVDANGEPASQAIQTAVYNYIMSPNDRNQRKAPIGAVLVVTVPTSLTITIAVASVTLDGSKPSAEVISAFKDALSEYYSTAKESGLVRYNQIHRVLTEVDGIDDFSGLTVNGATSNVMIPDGNYPYTGTENITFG